MTELRALSVPPAAPPDQGPETAPHPASRRQIEAADPRVSTWLGANAGSGKTRVLTDRVARLLLGGTDPQAILCLTFTKAAAAEMQTRLFRRLGAWALMPDAPLVAELRALGLTEGIGPLDLPRARRLFAQALETPGGLRIQTIHAFCAALLRRFPLEAGVSPQFRELDDGEAAALRAEVAEALALGPEGALLEAVARHDPRLDLDELLQAVLTRRDSFLPAATETELRAALGLKPESGEDSLLACLEGAERRQLLREAAAVLQTGRTKGDKAAAALFERIAARTAPTLDDLAALADLCLYKSGDRRHTAKPDAFLSAELRKSHPELAEALRQLAVDVEAAHDLRLCLAAHDRNRALHAWATAFMQAYEQRKAACGALDFDDLIARALGLLTDPAVASWVLWRLDGGIDHILVDEAQDTSPAQWAVIRRLAEEMTSGWSADPDRPRTLFVVGDRKQSIFSFQGADAEGFDGMAREFGTRMAQAGRRLMLQDLEYSFRSSPVVLRAVDACFAADHGGLGNRPPCHRAFRAQMPGRVDLWAPIPPAESAGDDRPWTDPVDARSPRDPDRVLAARIAQTVRAMLDSGHVPVERDGRWYRRPVTPGDIMILVQRRNVLFHAIIRELKAADLPVAGADRLRLREELAVRDVEAVLRFLALPQDCLALACALRSPLFGWSERQLYDLARPRPEGQTLWEALEAAPPAPHVDHARAVLHDLRDRADFLRPHELIARLLLRHDGRRRLVARLGPECEDGLDALLAQALAWEAQAVPSLTGFLAWRAGDRTEVKRQMGTADGRIRVMTVHGAKGLEAPVVILPDCRKRRPGKPPPLLAMKDGRVAVWPGPVEDQPRILRERRAASIAAEAHERQRLLYVALTRAESWLVVCAAGDCGNGAESWHGLVREGLRRAGAAEQDFGHEEGPGSASARPTGTACRHCRGQKRRPIRLPPIRPPCPTGGRSPRRGHAPPPSRPPIWGAPRRSWPRRMPRRTAKRPCAGSPGRVARCCIAPSNICRRAPIPILSARCSGRWRRPRWSAMSPRSSRKPPA
ncbi:DNA helicase/exodeoxyribonuclease V, subunit A [Rubellimicrobium thermophilum DSM 16684]|uniref:DNA 3'-5' helicase n=1 Tax=Rubellimicrobium thermophilum DSM 16684 TaxID=1123069 RepID=S9QXN9_9RHOB|nr:DNA helicase/exodeoxyribonuclease V, subunit A [Rubellimicrobium thermophilum DSM 16684]